MVRATVVIPTHDHQDMIMRAIASVRRQTIQDYEVFVIGDGVPERTRALMAEVCAEDKRFRYFDHPKGPRTGEIYRHQALQEATGEVVCYLADDDLWLPDHLTTMLEAGSSADFFHSMHLGIHPESGFYCILSSVEDEAVRYMLRNGTDNKFGLSFCAHTLNAYRSLPFGWRTSPDGVPTDLHMWQQFLQQPNIRARTVFKITALNFAAPQRKGWSREQRLQELDKWLEASDDLLFSRKLNETLAASVAAKQAARQ
jgi:glycosyltransferase involved in cell wall biosynthesis